MRVCAFKSGQARTRCWESGPVPFSWPLRARDGDATSQEVQRRNEQLCRTSSHGCSSWTADTALGCPAVPIDCLGLLLTESRCLRIDCQSLSIKWLSVGLWLCFPVPDCLRLFLTYFLSVSVCVWLMLAGQKLDYKFISWHFSKLYQYSSMI